jgi:chemotaxis response regulator CheB
VSPDLDEVTPTSTRVVLASADPLFAALCHRVLAGSSLELLAAVPPAELLETTRQLAPDLLILDSDGEDALALRLLATKVMLVSQARLVLVSAYLSLGSPGLSALLQSIAASFVQKPGGPSSLGLIDEDGPRFLAALQATLTGLDPEELLVPPPPPAPPVSKAGAPAEALDSGWDLDEERHD